MSGAPGRGRSSVPLVVLLGVVAVAILGAGVALLANGTDDEPAAGDEQGTGSDSGGGVVVRDAWTAPNQGATAVYLTVDNPGSDDRLVAVSSDVAESAALMGGDVDMAQESSGDAVSLVVPSGETELRPGAPHLMLQGLAAPLQPGTTFPLRLDFEDAGPIGTAVEVVSWDEAADREG
ncbi:MAG TPA: copper chaperone PCu(A)C [Acidimicrobiales bacterium]|nr:copper chaperone PCu(A)C [Acidimicrobiales bacterium]